MRENRLTTAAISFCQFAAAVLVTGVLGCGSGAGAIDGGPTADAAPGTPDAAPPDAGPVAATAICDEMTGILCAAEQACCTDQGRRYASAADCIAAQRPACIDSLQSPATDGRTGYDPAIARRELDELAGRVASCDPTINEWFVSHVGLLRIYQGTVAGGGDCSPSSATDTAPVLSCRAPNVCRLTPLPLSGTCGAARTSGQSCVTEIECVDGLRCDPPESLSGTCKARLADNSGCAVNGDCESLICRGSSCLPATVDNVYCFDVN